MVKFWKTLAIVIFVLGTFGSIISGEYIDGLIAVFLSGMVCLSVSSAFDAMYSIRDTLQAIAEMQNKRDRKEEKKAPATASSASSTEPYYQKFHSGKWTCKDCGYENDNVSQYCKQCGEYK